MKSNLLDEYREYVRWCKSINLYPIGFVNWKAEKYGCMWDNKKEKYVKKDNKEEQK